MRIALKPFNLTNDLLNQVKFISPNIHELNTIAEYFGSEPLMKNNEDIEHIFKEPFFIQKVKQASAEIAKHIDNIIVTLGSNGILITRKFTPENSCFFNEKLDYIASDTSDIQHRFYSVKEITDIVNVSGAGDSFNSGFISAMINGSSEDICISVGMESAKVAIKSIGPVPNFYFDKNHECWHNPAPYNAI